MDKIILKVEIIESKDDKAFLVYDENYEFIEAVGVARGIHYAINNYVESFNDVGYCDYKGNRLQITNEDVELEPRRSRTIRKTITLV